MNQTQNLLVTVTCADLSWVQSFQLVTMSHFNISIQCHSMPFCKFTYLLPFWLWPVYLNLLNWNLRKRNIMSHWDPRIEGLNTGSWIFIECKIPRTCFVGGTLGCGSQVWRFTELLKNLKHKKKGLWANLICHIHVLIIPQFLPKWS